MNDKSYIFVCSICKGTNIQQKAWVDVNTDKVFDSCSDGELQDNWCEDCQDHTRFETVEQELKKET